MNKVEGFVSKWSVRLLFFMAVSVLVPTGVDYDHVVSPVKNLTPDLAMDYDRAMAEMDAVFVQMRPYFETTTMRYSAEDALVHKLRALKVNRYFDEDRYRYTDPQKSEVVTTRNRALLKLQSDLFFGQPDKVYQQEQMMRYNQLSDQSAEFRQVTEFRAHDTDFDGQAYLNFLRYRYPFSMLLAGLGFVGLMRARRLSVLAELFPPFQFAVALLFWPVAILVYPYADPKQQVTKVVNFAATAMSFLLSCSGMAIAQTPKKGADKKSKGQSSFQVDARMVAPLVDNPDLTINVRGTLNAHRAVVETITVANTAAGVVYNETGLGVAVHPGVNAIALVTKSRGSDAGWAAGLQIFKPVGKKVFLATPVLRYESGGKGFLVAQPAFALSKKWSFTPEVSVKVGRGRAPSIGLGISLRLMLGRKFVEGSLLESGAIHSARLRYSQTVAF